MNMTRRNVELFVWICVLVSCNCIMGAFADISTVPECKGGAGCLKCDHNNTGRCVKCAHLIMLGSRQCVEACPPGYNEEWSSLVNYMGRMCRESGFFGLPGRTLAVVVGTFSGAAICLGVLVGGYVYLRSRRSRKPPCSSRGHANSIHDLDLDTPDRREFLKHLALLRHEAPVFLAMLNDTRKQVRDLHQLNHASDSAIQAYRPVLRDLVRILTLLNRSPERILSPPGDWVTLLAWGERVLRRYKKQHPHQVAQAQLVSFLQVPIQTNHATNHATVTRDREHHNLSTFQPFNTLPNPNNNNHKSHTKPNQSNQLQELAITTFNSNYNNAPMANSFNNSNDVVLRRDVKMLQQSILDSSSDFNPNWEFHPPDYTILAEWSANRDYLADDFITLGFRPQDEITTEL